MERRKQAFLDAFASFLWTDRLAVREDEVCLEACFRLFSETFAAPGAAYAAQLAVYMVREPPLLRYVAETFDGGAAAAATDEAKLTLLGDVLAASATAVPKPGLVYRSRRVVNGSQAKVGEANVATPEGARMLLHPDCRWRRVLLQCGDAAAATMAAFRGQTPALRTAALARLGAELARLPGVATAAGTYTRCHLLRHLLLLHRYEHPDDQLTHKMSTSVTAELTSLVALAFGNSAAAFDAAFAARCPPDYCGARSELANFLCVMKPARALLRAIAGDVRVGGLVVASFVGYGSEWRGHVVELVFARRAVAVCWFHPEACRSVHALAEVARWEVLTPSNVVALRWNVAAARLEGQEAGSGRWVHDGVTEAWVRENALGPLVRECRAQPGVAVELGPGAADDGGDLGEAPTGQTAVVHRQHDENACLTMAVRNALHALGGAAAAYRGHATLLGKKRGRNKRRRVPQAAGRVVDEVARLGGYAVTYVDPPVLTGGDGTDDAANRLTVLLGAAAAAGAGTSFVVQLRDAAGARTHVVAVHRGRIFDSNKRWTRPLAGGAGFHDCTFDSRLCVGVEAAIRIERSRPTFPAAEKF